MPTQIVYAVLAAAVLYMYIVYSVQLLLWNWPAHPSASAPPTSEEIRGLSSIR
jgi:hypothetical protein